MMKPVTTTDRRGGRSRARFAVVVLGLLFGLLGMHALSLHGANATPDANLAASHGAHTVEHVSQAGSHSTGDTAAALVDAATDKAAHAAAVDDSGHDGGHDGGGMSGHGGHDGGAMLMMCLAVLAVALALLWPALDRSRGYLLLLRLTLTRITPIRSLRLGTGPPPVWQFSVIRC